MDPLQGVNVNYRFPLRALIYGAAVAAPALVVARFFGVLLALPVAFIVAMVVLWMIVRSNETLRAEAMESALASRARRRSRRAEQAAL